MTKVLSILFCAIFFVLCTFFSVGLLLPGASDMKEEMEDFPQWITDNGLNHHFGNEFEEWFSKNFAFSDTVTDVYASLKMRFFAEGNEQVIVGRDDFLFFNETTADFIGTAPMTDEAIEKTAVALKNLQKQAEEKGADFLFVCAPNKNTIYGAKMPLRYQKSTTPTNLDRLYDALDKQGVAYVDLRPELLEAGKNELVYHRRDTHWNGVGAALAFSRVSEYFGVSMSDLTERGPVAVQNFAGDLDALLFPGRVLYDQDITYDFNGLYIFTSAYSTPMDIVITARGGGEKKLLMFRDSFANAWIPYAASTFSEIRLERATPYRTEYLDSFEPDCVVVEIAERNLYTLPDAIGTDR